MIKIKTQKKLMFVPVVNFFVIVVYMCIHKVPQTTFLFNTWHMLLNFFKGGLIWMGGVILMDYVDAYFFPLPSPLVLIGHYIGTILMCHFLIKYQIKIGVE